MNAIDFALRTPAGAVERGAIGSDSTGFVIQSAPGTEISLNLNQSDLRGYDRAGDDLLVTLADGRVIVIQNYFSHEGRLFLSANSQLNEVFLDEAEDGVLFAAYGPAEGGDKWSPSDALVFYDEPVVVAMDSETATGDDDVSMLATGLLGLGGLGSTVGIGAAGIGGAALIGAGIGGSGGSNDGEDQEGDDDGETGSKVSTGWPAPDEPEEEDTTGDDKSGGGGETPDEPGEKPETPRGEEKPDDETPDEPGDETPEEPGDDPRIEPTINDADVPIKVSASDEPRIEISGTAQPGSTVDVTIGGKTVSTTSGGGGTWKVVFEGETFPDDGTYDVIADVTEDDGTETELVREDVLIDVTPPVLEIEVGTEGVGHVVNAEDHADGIEIAGTSEPGATVTVTVKGEDHVVTVGAEGTWSVTVDSTLLEGGTYLEDIVVSARDAIGNVTLVSDRVSIDTETAVSIDNTPLTGDDIVSAAEYDGGLTLSGSAEAGASVVVEIEGASASAVAGANGAWSVTFAAGSFAAGTYDATAHVTSSDAAGNIATVSHGFKVDTEQSLTIEDETVEGEGVVNAAERSDGVTLTGAGEPGASVEVTMAGATRTGTVGETGIWSIDFAASDLPEGETSVSISAVSTDAAGNVETATGEIDVDTLVRDFAFTGKPGGSDGIVNGEERAEGLTLTGTTEPGASVVVSLGGVSHEASVAADGSWSVSFAKTELPEGETTVTFKADSTDLAGNVETRTQDVVIDTDAGTLTISPEPVEGDDIVNKAEASDGVTLTGTSEPGQVVTVTLAGVSRDVTTGADGVWVADYAAGEIAPGTYEAEIVATITDPAGNTLTRTDSLRVDTEVQNFGISTAPIEGDDVVNKVEAKDGIELTGTTEPGASVTVTVEGVTRAATVDADGNWSVSYAASEIPAGTYDTVAEVSTTDVAGNTATASRDFRVDTEVTPLSMNADAIAGDGVVNAAEAAGGITIGGEVEAGSTVSVLLAGKSYAATVAANGSWTVDIPASGIPEGELTVPVTVSATDAAGNTRAIADSIEIDTIAPDAPQVQSYTRDHTGLRGISLTMSDDDVAIGHVVNDATVEGVSFASADIPILNETAYVFDTKVPDGSHLVVTATDDAGNTSGTYLVVDDTTTSDVAMTDGLASTLSAFEIGTIDLQFAEDSQFTITDAQLATLTGGDALTVTGGSDDQVTATGAINGGTTTEDGQTFNVYALGDGTLKIDDDITNVVI